MVKAPRQFPRLSFCTKTTFQSAFFIVQPFLSVQGRVVPIVLPKEHPRFWKEVRGFMSQLETVITPVGKNGLEGETPDSRLGGRFSPQG